MDVLAEAQRTGTARAIITLRTPMMGGNLSKASFAEQTLAHKRALDGALTPAASAIAARTPTFQPSVLLLHI